MIEDKIEETKEEIYRIKNKLIEEEKTEVFKKIRPLLMNINKSLRFSEDFKRENREMFRHVVSVEAELRIEEIDDIIDKDDRCSNELSRLRKKLVELKDES
ncbi:hypothetical protein C9439_04510 [archaeon SCG-AAA382B04]|nr:hypothetical protein C9439_04510 [archaeon SCG-AAA382B04]